MTYEESQKLLNSTFVPDLLTAYVVGTQRFFKTTTPMEKDKLKSVPDDLNLMQRTLQSLNFKTKKALDPSITQMQDIVKEIKGKFDIDSLSGIRGTNRNIAVLFFYTGLSVVRNGRLQILINTNDDTDSYFDIE